MGNRKGEEEGVLGSASAGFKSRIGEGSESRTLGVQAGLNGLKFQDLVSFLGGEINRNGTSHRLHLPQLHLFYFASSQRQLSSLAWSKSSR